VLLFTSGTTGDPKAAVILHRHLVAQFEAHRCSTGAGEADTLVNWSPLFHNMGLARAGLATLVYGWRAVLVPPGLATVRLWLETITARRATITASADSGFRAATARVDRHGIDLRSLRYAISGGEGVRADTIARFERQFGLEGVVTPGYGLSEATLGVSMLRPGEPLRIDANGRVTNGRPHQGFTVRITDDRGTDRPAGTPGTVLVAGPSVFAGYFGDEPATRAVLRDGWLDTGDVGALDADGHLYIHGRRRALIKRAGVTIAPRDVEQAACSVTGIAAAVAVGLTGTPDEDEALVVVAEVDPDAAPSSSGGVPDLAGTVAREVARAIGATPERVVLVGPGQLPRTDTGKVRDAAVRALIAPADRPDRDPR
jgi:acyl-CoA synthetase (AMP-forming)/AMP-acid ligase II